MLLGTDRSRRGEKRKKEERTKKKKPATEATKIIALQGLLLGTDRCRKKALRSRLRQYLYLCTSKASHN
jgi:hypothetical protein